MAPSATKVLDISNFPKPSNSKSLRCFLGMTGFYRKLIPNYATKVLAMTELIKNFPNEKCIELNEIENNSFENIKNELAGICSMPHPIPNVKNYQIVSDSSKYAVGAALHQMVEGEPVPIGFFSKKLTEPQRRLSTFERELLAAYLAVIHFRSDLEGKNVVLYTDHKPLVSAFRKTTPSKSEKQQRYLSLLSEYVTDIAYVRGKDNIVADCLSRPANAVSIDLFDLPAISAQQKESEEIMSYKDRLKMYKIGNHDLWCDVSTPYPRPFVPDQSRKSIFDYFHNLAHSGNKTMLKLIKSRYFWPNMDKQIREWTRSCTNCQESKIGRHTKTKSLNFTLPSNKFETVHIDIVGPLNPVTPINNVYPASPRYILTCIDRATRWIEAIPMENISALTVAISFLNVWVSRFGVPLHVVTDRGTQFESELFSELSKLLGFHRLRTTAYHCQANGLIERQHRTIKTAIMSRKQNWLDALPIVLIGLRNTPLENGYSPSYLVTGNHLMMPKVIFDNESRNYHKSIEYLAGELCNLDFSVKNKSKSPTYFPKELKSCDYVWMRIDRVRRPLEAPYTGPHKVIEKHEKYFIIEFKFDQTRKVSVDRLKPYVDCIKKSTNRLEEPIQQESPIPEPLYKTRSGRNVRFAKDDDILYY